MKKVTRRDFLGKSTLGFGTILIAPNILKELSSSNSTGLLKMPLGFQAWTIREMLVKDFPGTLKMMADMGYRSIEMCSPPGYANSGFGPLVKYSAREMKRIINDAGLIWPSSHYVMDELRNNLDERIKFAIDSGQTQMVLSSFGLPREATLADWHKAADELNSIGEKVRKAGLQMGFHNHHNEFQQLEGKLIYDELMRYFDPTVIKMQFQVAVISIGYKAADYFRKYPGRFISAHLADWSAETKKEAPAGKGVVDWKEFFAAIETGGVKNVFVEMSPDTFKDSAEYLLKL
ncbi:MAG TPA: TIM barrel protein [Bacteroidales bacterium]|nr:TIM barrel protein [Bacteroidales bacterium]HQG36375.1 TIM barrel protein [Bacteroidales bacterium]HQG53791.1 TIM barrel protein [Bacteroidales bacterium]HQJ21115.1 TIM barrel protein [Bacteroidales bacterium]